MGSNNGSPMYGMQIGEVTRFSEYQLRESEALFRGEWNWIQSCIQLGCHINELKKEVSALKDEVSKLKSEQTPSRREAKD